MKINEKKQTSSIKQVALIAALFLGYTMIYIDKLSIGITLVPMAEKYGISASEKGFIMSAFFFGYALMQVPMGFLNLKLGSKRIVCFSLFGIAIFASLLSFGTSVLYFILIRFLAGAIAHSGYAASAAREVQKQIDEKRQTFAQGILLSSSGIASVLGPKIVTPAVVNLGWSVTYLLLAVLAIVIGVILFFVIPRQTKEEVKEEKITKESLFQVAKNPVAWVLFFGAFFLNSLMYGAVNWIPSFLTGAKGMSLTQAGSITSIVGFFFLLGAILGSFIVGKKFAGNEKNVISICASLSAIFLLLAYFMPTTSLLTMCLGLGDLFCSTTFVTLMSLPLKRFAQEVFAPSYALVATGGILGGVVSPSLIGILVQASNGGYFPVFCYFAILGVLSAMVIRRISNKI
ncbi:Sugar phosphate permease [Pilibacter termitis]|uniref:Sugar phosphate permease n=1 Tax=Pilibacter termitis TaxID=263852 RepID=A0A1T4MZD6_9ENTE|nr:MFS transporter [Pilibacter termitis]SJZ72147.1 Sugar phosphate permease [Pilibacter termitis]